MLSGVMQEHGFVMGQVRDTQETRNQQPAAAPGGTHNAHNAHTAHLACTQL